MMDFDVITQTVFCSNISCVIIVKMNKTCKRNRYRRAGWRGRGGGGGGGGEITRLCQPHMSQSYQHHFFVSHKLEQRQKCRQIKDFTNVYHYINLLCRHSNQID